MSEKFLTEQLIEKWSPILESSDLPEIKDHYRKSVTAVLLENEERALAEATPTNVAGGVQNWDPVLIGMVRRAMPHLIAFDIAGVQPMTMPTGLVFAMKSKYTSQGGAEALWNEATNHSGTGAFAGAIGSFPLAATVTNASTTVSVADTSVLSIGSLVVGPGIPVGATVADITNGTDFLLSAAATANGTSIQVGMGEVIGTATGFRTDIGEGDIAAKMAFEITRTSVEAKTHQLTTGYSVELAQDMRAVHGLDAEAELSNILSRELITEQNRRVLRDIYTVAKAGAQKHVAVPGMFDVQGDSDGRWLNEKFKGLLFAIERDLNAVALDVRLGKGNIMVTSADVASALAAAGVLDYAPAIQNLENLNSDFTQNTFVGVMGGGRVKVFVDPYSSGDFYMVGYKGASPYAAGYFLCPYVPAQILRATDPASFQPLLAMKLRYGIAYNPLSGSGSFRQNAFYRVAGVTNLAG